ncbi:ABC transporter ATP-binding protein [Ruixingdingia sedimenti]|uniref:ABC transporter ATP-binding protein n=1 Tax=Ruixingdingia sedimenti TaxID=3073604 RepID=A0ABU1F8R9_9RHOB|nr:ABC transporter ATP-binding protein [Xinfangfangia sp. LG-4]MDR5653256.1 ABC transporter ATP-binding protein [Xinfangfangia sp. LG-4]
MTHTHLHDGQAHALALENLSVVFGGVRALSDVSLGIHAGRGIEAIIGPNGAGKTTLFNVLTGVVAPTGGRLMIDGQDMTGRRQDHIFRRGISRTFQGVRLFAHLTAEQNVAIAARSVTGRAARAQGRFAPGWFEGGQGRDRTLAALDRVGLPAASRRRLPSQLTLWERRMVEIARAISSEPAVLLLDEPAAGLNTAEKARLRDLLARLAGDLDCHLVVVEHDMSFVMSIASRVRVLNFGRLLADGTPAEVQADSQVREAYLGTSHEEAGA